MTEFKPKEKAGDTESVIDPEDYSASERLSAHESISVVKDEGGKGRILSDDGGKPSIEEIMIDMSHNEEERVSPPPSESHREAWKAPEDILIKEEAEVEKVESSRPLVEPIQEQPKHHPVEEKEQEVTPGTGSLAMDSNTTKYREIYMNSDDMNADKKFMTNYVTTTKYTFYNFVPKCLFIQFMRVANIYFLIIAILQSIPMISPLNPASAIIPLVFVLVVSLLREGFEDYGRYKEDQKSNDQCVLVFRGEDEKEKDTKAREPIVTVSTRKWYHATKNDRAKVWKKQTSRDIKVGYIVKIVEDEAFPADIILLATSNKDLTAYIETGSLDGEKNLKKKTVPGEIIQNRCVPEMILNGEAICIKPSKPLSEFSGKLKLSDKKKPIPVGNGQLLLRGAKLKNTQWAIGLVCYTGLESKIMLNSQSSRFKQSKIEKTMNHLIIGLLLLMIIICIIVASLSSWFHEERVIDDEQYVEYTYQKEETWFIKFFSYFLLLNTFIPISLIVTLEIVKFIQKFLMEWDVFMYTAENDRFCTVHTCSINEELGQIKYIFSDKTGTLTSNSMELQLLLIVNQLYGNQAIIYPERMPKGHLIHRAITHKDECVQYSFEDRGLKDILIGRESRNPEQKRENEGMLEGGNYDIGPQLRLESEQRRCLEFVKLLSICHECGSCKDDTGEITHYQGPSPDEIALVDSARHIGLRFTENVKDVGSVENILERDHIETIQFEVIEQMVFNSDRKRMSVLVKDLSDQKYKLYTKGADSIIMARLNNDNTPQGVVNVYEDFLQQASVRGYRTLMMAMKVFSEQEYIYIKAKLDDAKEDLANKEARLQECYEEIEQGLTYIGCSAVEDKLQDKVPETIAELQKAGISIWMLTGDKLETAENIGKSCRLIDPTTMTQHKLDYSDEDRIKEFLSEREGEKDKVVQTGEKEFLLITSDALGMIMDKSGDPDTATGDPTMIRSFVDFAMRCTAIVCCRASPAQKAQVVKAIKDRCEGEITLAIGDGANDVSMILEAHIGIGIFGKEGMRAAQTSDYAIGEFKSLWKLILIHGRLAYLRIGEMILYFFYKNGVFTLPQLGFAFWSSYSGQTIYDDWYLTFYNMIFTCFPLAFKAVFEFDIHHIKDQDMINADKVYPHLYYKGQYNWVFTYKNFIFWWLLSAVHASIIFFFPLYCFEGIVLHQNGKNGDIWSLSVTSFTAVVVVVTIKLGLFERLFNIVSLIGFAILSFLLYFIYVWVSNYLPWSKTMGTIVVCFTCPQFYLLVILCSAICFLGDYFMRVFCFYALQSPNDYTRKWVNDANKMPEEEREIIKAERMRELAEITNKQRKIGEKQLLDGRNKNKLKTK